MTGDLALYKTVALFSSCVLSCSALSLQRLECICVYNRWFSAVQDSCSLFLLCAELQCIKLTETSAVACVCLSGGLVRLSAACPTILLRMLCFSAPWVSLSVCLSVRLAVCLTICPVVWQSICLPIRPSPDPSLLHLFLSLCPQKLFSTKQNKKWWW